GEGFGWTVPDRLAQPLAQGAVDLLECLARGNKCVGQGLAHSDGLTALARENQRDCHLLLLPLRDEYCPQGRREKYRHGSDVKAIAVTGQAANKAPRRALRAHSAVLAFPDRPRIRPVSARPRPGAERTAVQTQGLAR